jgi:hypothetical protein
MESPERWAPVRLHGLETYQASTHGRVRNAAGRVLAQHRTRSGYMCATLRCRVSVTKRVHRLVASAFFQDWNEALTVDHIDGVRHHNSLSNLRMATAKDQAANAVRPSNRRGHRIQQLTPTGKVVGVHESLAAAARAVGVRSSSAIARCVAGVVPWAHGFVWRYPPHLVMEEETWAAWSERVLLSTHGRYRWRSGPVLGARDLPANDGYPFFRDGAAKVYVHIAVARLFLPPPPSAKHAFVNHRDGDRTNAHWENLEWVTREGNVQHAYATGLIKKNRKSKLHNKVHEDADQGKPDEQDAQAA